jgi:hypothetical protein
VLLDDATVVAEGDQASIQALAAASASTKRSYGFP